MPDFRHLLLLLLVCLHSAHAADNDEWLYRIKQGDTLWSIARQHLTSLSHVPMLQQKNGIRDPYTLTPGSDLRIPIQWVRQQTANATVSDLVGSASLSRNNTVIPLVRDNQYALPSGTVIRTAANSTLKLLLEDGSLINIGPNAQFTIKQSVHFPTTGANNTWLDIDHGSIDNNVSKNPLMPNRHTIQTPSAITAVRGTQFRVNVSDNSRSATEVSEGNVEVSAGGKTEHVESGYGSLTHQGGEVGQRTKLPPPPALPATGETQAFSPAIISWPAVSGISGYQLNLMRNQPERQLVDDTLVDRTRYYPSIGNGQYTLQVRSQLPDGLQGIPVQQNFSVRAFPAPPLVVSPPPDARLRTLSARFILSGSTHTRYRLRLSRDTSFSQPREQDISGNNNLVQLEQEGTWFWQIAKLDQDNQPGPFSQPYRLQANQGWLRASYYEGMVLSARPYPVPHAHYRLTLTKLDQQDVPLVLQGEKPLWQLKTWLFPGTYRVSYHISSPDGYTASEPDDVLLIH